MAWRGVARRDTAWRGVARSTLDLANLHAGEVSPLTYSVGGGVFETKDTPNRARKHDGGFFLIVRGKKSTNFYSFLEVSREILEISRFLTNF